MGCLPVPWPGREQTSPSISGRILDSVTTRPVEGARVQIHERPKTSVLSDTNGEFRVMEMRQFYLISFVTGQNVYHFPRVQERSYLFDVSHPNYETAKLFGLNRHVRWEQSDTNQSSTLVVSDTLLIPKEK
ncbi:MAG: hypothetical protein JWM68_458 [Verrucomicrobiales bacterium]|nr:hypothetical protein [Verrucomicrobiales bacterium]